MAVDVFIGDAIEVLNSFESETVQSCITSPPYWGQRDYEVAGQYGLEPTIEEHLDKMVEVFEEVKRVLKPSGTLWLNYGDSYASAPNGRPASDITGDDRTFRDKPMNTIGGTLKSKDLCMTPNRLAIKMQEAGWYVRSEIIWVKPNPMPESVTDRPAMSHEKIWLMSKEPIYYYDADAVRQGGMDYEQGYLRRHWKKMTTSERPATERHLRNVWVVNTQAFKGAHMATFPTQSIVNCIFAGTKPNDLILDPFGGAGTVGLVAHNFGRNARLIEIKKEYAELAADRINRSEAGQASMLQIAKLWQFNPLPEKDI